MVTCVACGVCLMMIAMLTRGGLASDETCADMEFEGLTQDVTVSVEKDTYINVTFLLNTSKCPEDGNSFRVKVLANQGGFSVSVCVFVIKKTSCSVTEKSDVCYCLLDTEGWARVFHLPNDTGLVTCIFRWSGHNSATIKFDVFNPTTTHFFTTAEETSSTSTEEDVENKDVENTNISSGTVTASTTKSNTSTEDKTKIGIAAGTKTTSPGFAETKSEGDNFQVIFFTSIITALVIGVPFVAGIVIYVCRVKKKRKGMSRISQPAVTLLLNFSHIFDICFKLVIHISYTYTRRSIIIHRKWLKHVFIKSIWSHLPKPAPSSTIFETLSSS
ncbi:uncharacterized protein LOC112568313 [Pomacea canaliculata]|uniref:uncharacterized protein LOC112568313 n=1 Tax=Pomacea canaliculata TaxID=400727 RepID=UPI000D7326C4|nr:uncharacterized protein LOC112568313 [Pomacea canaliculata]XP_025101342.1 uncharacterized protein LOC112568313 [Pomacea canaliculata]XP_025101343.1 uncharacterized protein LOC112568313 [Pomacea canaliculata]XP_025101344.1 uncharacterized protein LOC112568313 [Pomacea canaliculata]XP_025101345.1 uncharacterized protein LOC112568313 [Pomacea canaliculata]XP_025101346.1 uncharacterized protein LOC112568313 [Pomacea canaliculata]XP_025101347.1 uncharacterized protein LOC112568313 [Pomacea cana